MIEQNTRRGIALMLVTVFLFAVQDGLSRYLGGRYPVFVVVMLRYWFLVVWLLALNARAPGGLGAALRSHHPVIQTLRGLLLAGQICVMVVAFVKLGLVETHAVFVICPLIVTALSGPFLGEKVGWRRWSAIGAGFVGVLIVLNPGSGVFSPLALIPFVGAICFAVYGLLTRYVSLKDSARTSYLWTGLSGAVLITPLGLWYWQPLAPLDWLWMLALCINAAVAHYLFIRVYEVAEASAVQPFAYFQLPFVAVIGVFFFGDVLKLNVIVGAAIVIAAGLFTFWRERVRAREERLAAISAPSAPR